MKTFLHDWSWIWLMNSGENKITNIDSYWNDEYSVSHIYESYLWLISMTHKWLNLIEHSTGSFHRQVQSHFKFCNRNSERFDNSQFRDSIVVSIPASRAGDRGSIPRRGAFFEKFISRKFILENSKLIEYGNL